LALVLRDFSTVATVHDNRRRHEVLATTAIWFFFSI